MSDVWRWSAYCECGWYSEDLKLDQAEHLAEQHRAEQGEDEHVVNVVLA